MKTYLRTEGTDFLINDRLTYEELPNCAPRYHGLLMNARFIQGVFDDTVDPLRFHRFGRCFDANTNTEALIAALPQWYRCGLRAFTVGFQGGGPCFTITNDQICNNPFSPDGLQIAPDYLARMAKLLNAADELGMVVIVSILYGGQSRHFNDAQAVINAIRTASAWLRQGGWQNVIIEVVNEYDSQSFRRFPLIQTPQGVVALMDIARRESGLPVGCSGIGGTVNEEVIRASDIVLIHGNGQSRQLLLNRIQQAQIWAPAKPIVCNEDSQALGNLQVCLDHHVSWGYFNDLTKQEPPVDWRITEGEDQCFAYRLASALGIPYTAPQEAYQLVGYRKNECWQGRCWPRIAALYPETINYTDYYLDGTWLQRSYDEPFSLFYLGNWIQKPLYAETGILTAKITLTNGEVLIRSGCIGQ